MGTIAELEKSIKQNQEVIGGVLLGMHQDLQEQQKTVDKKISAWVTKFSEFESGISGHLVRLSDDSSKFHYSAQEILSQGSESIHNIQDKVALLVDIMNDKLDHYDSVVIKNSEALMQMSSDNWGTINKQIVDFFNDTHAHANDLDTNIKSGIETILVQTKNDNNQLSKGIFQLQKENNEFMNELKLYMDFSKVNYDVLYEKINSIDERYSNQHNTIVEKLNLISVKSQISLWMNAATIALIFGLFFLAVK